MVSDQLPLHQSQENSRHVLQETETTEPPPKHTLRRRSNFPSRRNAVPWNSTGQPLERQRTCRSTGNTSESKHRGTTPVQKDSRSKNYDDPIQLNDSLATTTWGCLLGNRQKIDPQQTGENSKQGRASDRQLPQKRTCAQTFKNINNRLADKKNLATFTFKELKGISPIVVNLKCMDDNRHQRQKNKKTLEIPRHRSSIAEFSLAVHLPRLWNELPTELRTSEKLSTFKKMLKEYLVKNQFL